MLWSQPLLPSPNWTPNLLVATSDGRYVTVLGKHGTSIRHWYSFLPDGTVTSVEDMGILPCYSPAPQTVVGTRILGLCATFDSKSTNVCMSDAWGHFDCKSSGPCYTKPLTACNDQNPCTSDRCTGAAAGCTFPRGVATPNPPTGLLGGRSCDTGSTTLAAPARRRSIRARSPPRGAAGAPEPAAMTHTPPRDPLRAAVHACTDAIAVVGERLVARVADPHRPGDVSNDALHACGDEVFAYAQLHAAVTAVGGLLDLLETRTPPAGVGDLWRFAVAHALLDVRARFVRWAATAGDAPRFSADVDAALAAATGLAAVERLAPWLLDGGAWSLPAYALDADHADVRAVFRDFADAEVAPLAESIHRHDTVLPEALLKAYAELGALGITIPERYGGQFVDTRAMALATEELARASLGAGGSVITRPEIASKALLKGGTEEQKRRWLPRIARGQDVVAIAVTEPAAGSDVAAVRVQARRDGDGWRLRGEKTWCTFAGRASLLLVLARTGSAESKAKGLTLFLAEKPPVVPPADDRSFAFADGHTSEAYPAGGRLAGRAIPTIGYRGMHSFSVFFEDWYVPDSHRIGAEGEGFALQMAGFAGGRIQTAARAVGVMEAALRAAVRYTQERPVFGRRLSDLALTRRTLVEMAARVALCRMMTYATADRMDHGHGDLESSLVKLLACRTAEDVTRDAMQLHGGMGYSEEYAVSRYWQDARVLSIFEGAEEVLAVMVVGRALLRQRLAAR